jgi:hypothetical protein
MIEYRSTGREPIKGGIAPTSAPGIIASEVIFLMRYAVIKLSSPKGCRIKPFKNRQLPAIRSTEKSSFADASVTLSDGIGLPHVLSITESCSLSVYWFKTADPDARRNVPASSGIKPGSNELLCKKYPVPAENATANDSLYFIRSV